MIIGFIKFGQKDHIQDSFENEYLYFSPLKDFRSSVMDEFGRFDKREANLKIIQGNRLTLTIGQKTMQLHEMFSEFNCQFQEHPTVIPGNICSLYAMEMEGNEKKFTFDNRLFSDNGQALVIYNADKFAKALDKTLRELDIGQIRGKVTYYDYKTTSGDLSFFHKDSNFRYQNEYRLYLKTAGDTAMKINIPGLKDFSKILDFDKLQDLRAVVS